MNKRNVLTKGGNFFLIFCLFYLTYACRQEIVDFLGNKKDTTLSSDISRAKGIFEGLSPDFPCVQARSSGSVLKSIVIEPVWKDAFTDENETHSSVETNILLSKPFHVVPKESYEAYESTKDARYLNYLSRAVVLTEKSSLLSDAFIMTIVGSKRYMEKHDFQLWPVSYFNIPKDFSGMILYYSLDGNFVNGWEIEENNQISTCQPVSSEDAKLLSRSGSDCYIVEVTNTYVDCITHSGTNFTTYEGETLSFDWSETTCGSPYTETYSYMVCKSGSSDSSGGYSPPPSSNERYKYFKFIPQTMIGDVDRFLQYMREKDCVSRAILSTSENMSNFQPVNITVDPVKAPSVARYDEETNTIFLHDRENFRHITIYEELIHALQSKIYTYTETHNGALNMEFEAKLLIDYIGLSVQSVAETDLHFLLQKKGENTKTIDDFLENQIGKPFDANSFFMYMKQWKETTPSAYKDFKMDSSVEPKLIKEIVNGLSISCFNK